MGGKLFPVILSGGSGTRLWPLSRKSLPKQLLPLVGAHSLLQQAALRALDPKLFAEASDTCTVAESYVRNGRMSVQLRCKRAGQSGDVMQRVDGNFTKDSFEAQIIGSTSFGGSGDYAMTRSATAKRVGDCSAAAK